MTTKADIIRALILWLRAEGPMPEHDAGFLATLPGWADYEAEEITARGWALVLEKSLQLRTFAVEYQITPPKGRYGSVITLACTIDAADEAEALRLCQERAAVLWADAGTYEATRIREHGQGYAKSRAVVNGQVVA